MAVLSFAKATDSKLSKVKRQTTDHLKMYYTYILHNKITNRYYIGYTPDLRNRIKQHIIGKVKSTKSNLHYQLEWYCAFVTRKQAVNFEKYLKSGSGIAFMKKRFLRSNNVVFVKDTQGDDFPSEASA